MKTPRMKLDFPRSRAHKLGPVSGVVPSFYAEWRARCGVVPSLREDHESPPEHLLQAVWQHQRLLRDRLRTTDGEAVRILHPGFCSLEGGPDFRNAVVQFGDEPPRTGDIEVDLRASGWHAHGHDRNPAFGHVILHVVWEGEARASGKGAPPVLPLRQVLDARLGELSLWLDSEGARELPEEMRGQCCAPLRTLTTAQVLELLNQAAQVRLQAKAAQFQARARQAGWEQALWEGLFRALGYKHNVWAMQCLAELRPRWMQPSPAPEPDRLLLLQARLFGISGLLPAELTRTPGGTDNYLRRVWDYWWREQDQFSDCLFPRTLWRLYGLRPANHPQRRLALAAAWSAAGELAAKLEQWCAASVPRSALPASLLKIFQVAPDEFWSWHFTFRSHRLQHTQPLLGETRVTDLAVNVVLPWLWVRAAEGKNEKVRRAIEERYFAWPAAQDNSLLRLARQRLLAGASARALPNAAAQQGLLQVVRDFCDHSNAVCAGCKMPALVREFTSR
jgi:hypothetical protein